MAERSGPGDRRQIAAADGRTKQKQNQNQTGSGPGGGQLARERAGGGAAPGRKIWAAPPPHPQGKTGGAVAANPMYIFHSHLRANLRNTAI